MSFTGQDTGSDEPVGIFSDPEELRVFCAALDSFRQYRRVAHHNVTHRRRQRFYALPTAQWQMLASPPLNFLESLEQVDDAIDTNAEIAEQIVATTVSNFVQGLQSESWHGKATPDDMDKARSTIHQFYRDWSAEGTAEREACYGPILRILEREFISPESRKGTRVLVPGAGLGRLVFEICSRGFYAEGNEISYHQLLASYWALNFLPHDRRFKLFPFALDFMNVEKRSYQLKSMEIPDIHPATAMGKEAGTMNMTSGDFLSSYATGEHTGSFDAVVTAYFIDTAPNVIRYIEVLRECLRPNGLWINAGPLLWHFSEKAAPQPDGETDAKSPNEPQGIEAPGSFELTNEELIMLIQHLGFKIEEHWMGDEAEGYIRNPQSMLQNRFRCSFWVARKQDPG